MKTFRRLLTAVCAAVVLCASVTPAYAEGADTTDTTMVVVQDGDRTPSLATAIVASSANQSGLDVRSFLGTNADQIASLTGSLGGSASLIDAAANMPTTLSRSNLTAVLADAGAAFDWSGLRSYDELTAGLSSHASTLDGRVTIASASWATQLGMLHAPTLNSPGSLDYSMGQQVPEEGLAFGLALNSTFAALATDFPNLFDDVMSSGLGTPERQAAWNQSMLNASMTMPSSAGDIFNPCTVSMMTMALTGGSGSSGDPRCGSCEVAGEFLAGELASTFDSGFGRSLYNPTDGIYTRGDADFIGAQWLRDAATNTPGAPAELWMFQRETSPGACAFSNYAVTGTLGRTVPDVFSGLRTGN